MDPPSVADFFLVYALAGFDGFVALKGVKTGQECTKLGQIGCSAQIGSNNWRFFIFVNFLDLVVFPISEPRQFDPSSGQFRVPVFS